MKKEIEFLQGAFDSYKSSLHRETDDKWSRKQADLTNELEQKKNQELQELSKLMSHGKVGLMGVHKVSFQISL
ncbi:hypothetical protein DPMN_189413 [Dreissena polymorpha]|uniref:Uncharacterized protein n=1 Tax=Dreissena polymorpha TaxID=45954 RepID=A0A9D4DVG9_DREPO|nr:hypothetical protein DPMN_189413 [Dreissena polymorpha]